MIKEQYDPRTQKFYLEKKGAGTILLTAMAEGNLLTNFKKKVSYYLGRLSHHIEERIGIMVRHVMLKRLPIKKNRIVFGQFQNSYACNNKYIAEKIIEMGLDYELIFIVNRATINNREQLEIPKEVRLVERDTLDSFIALGTAHFWFDNALNCVWRTIPKKKGQIYMNVWHGSLELKSSEGINIGSRLHDMQTS